MGSDPKLQSALALAQALARLRAAEDWTLEAVETGEEQEGSEFVCVLRLRWAEAVPEDEEELKKFIL